MSFAFLSLAFYNFSFNSLAASSSSSLSESESNPKLITGFLVYAGYYLATGFGSGFFYYTGYFGTLDLHEATTF